MPYSPTTWTNGSTPVSQTNMNNIETGISGAYTELESITANDATALPSSNGAFTLANFINYLTSLVKSIVGGSNWYSSPPTSLTSLNTGKANLSGATFTGAVQATALTASSAGVTVSAANQGVELGAKASANTPFVDMNSSGNGTLNIAAASLTRNSQTVWDAGNDGAGSGLDADTVDGVQASSMLQFGTGGQKTGFKTTIGNTLPTTGMSKGDVHYLSPFALP